MKADQLNVIEETYQSINTTCICIICGAQFTVWSSTQKPMLGIPGQQTLFCNPCFDTLKAVMKREEQKNFGF